MSRISDENGYETIKILTTGDPHFKKSNMLEMEKFTQKFLELATRLKPDLIVNLGDTFDEHERNHTYAAEMFRKFMKNTTKIAPSVIIVGNHDRIDNQDFLTKLHQLGPYKGWSNVIVADKTKETTIKGKKFIFVPYVYKGRFIEALELHKTDFKTARAIFAHQEFRGANYGGGKSLDGDIWPMEYPLVISGHIHDYQKLQKNITYTGTPLQHTFGSERRKTVSLFTFPVETKNTYTEEKFDLKVVKKRKIKLKIDEAMSWMPKKSIPGELPIQYKIIIKGTSEAISVFQKTERCKKLEKMIKNIKFEREIVTRDEKTLPSLINVKRSFLGHFKTMITTRLEQKLYCDIFGFEESIFKITRKKRYILRRK